MGLFEFILGFENDFLGETPKLLAYEYNTRLFLSKDSGDKKLILQQIFERYVQATPLLKNNQNLLVNLHYDEFQQGISLVENADFDTGVDLAVFIFIIIFYESKKMRTELCHSSAGTRRSVYQKFFQMVLAHSPKGVICTLESFSAYIEKFILAYKN